MLRSRRLGMLEGLPDVDRLPQDEVRVFAGYPNIEHTRIFGPQAVDDRAMLQPSSEWLSVLCPNACRLNLGQRQRFFERGHIGGRCGRIYCSFTNIVKGPLDEVAEIGRLP